MKNLLLTKSQLTTYSVLAAAIFASQKSSGQIVYTDVDPDAFADADDSGETIHILIDFDNNGKVEIDLREYFFVSGSYYVIALWENKIEIGEYPTWYHPAYALNYGDLISDQLNFKKRLEVDLQFGAVGAWNGTGEHYLP